MERSAGDARDMSREPLGGFDRSFLVTMIRDFFVILVLVSLAEFALKAGLVVWSFERDGPAQTRAVAEEVADNVRQIMLNEGGPVAARTLYPILQENLEARGHLVEIAPSPVTVASIESTFGFVARGMPAPDWPEGRHNAATVELRAEAFCQDCHVQAEIGDVLGVVTVRNYLSRELEVWWKGVQLTGALALGKTVLHSVLLFLLLKARMAPLMALRGAVSGLSRAFGGLDRRVEVTSQDEFGALARDLNVFLDRLTRIVAELDEVLRRVVGVNDDIMRIQSDLRGRIARFTASMREVERRAMLAARREPMLSQEWFEAMGGSIAALRATAEADAAGPALSETLDRLSAVIGHARGQIETNAALFEDLARLGEEAEQFRDALAEMARLEERLNGVIESGAALVGRLQAGGAPSLAAADRRGDAAGLISASRAAQVAQP